MKIKPVFATTGHHLKNISRDKIEELYFFNNYKDYFKKIRTENRVDKKVFSTVIALYYNDKFRTILTNFRNNFNIPQDGFTYEEYNKKSGDFFPFLVEIRSYSYQSKLHPIIISSLHHLVFSNTFFLPPSNIFFYYGPDHELEINSRGNISFNEPEPLLGVQSVPAIGVITKAKRGAIESYLKKNFDKFEKIMEKYNKGKLVYISDRDFKIIDMFEEKKMTDKEIAEKLVDDGYGDHLFYWNVKSARSTARKKINSLL